MFYINLSRLKIRVFWPMITKNMQTKRNYLFFFHLDNKNKQCFLSPLSMHTCVILRTWQEFSYLF